MKFVLKTYDITGKTRWDWFDTSYFMTRKNKLDHNINTIIL